MLTSRKYLRQIFIAILGLVMVLPLGAAADTARVRGTDYFIAGVPTQDFVHFAAPEGAGRQRMQNWCWAACVQMVLNYHGLYVNQQEIVTRVFGATVDRPANGEQIIAALSGWAPDNRGRRSAIIADPYNLAPANIIKDLDERWPLIVGLSGARGAASGHAYVLTAAYFTKDSSGNPTIHRVVLRDPFPGYQSRIELDSREFHQRLQFATRVHVQRL